MTHEILSYFNSLGGSDLDQNEIIREAIVRATTPIIVRAIYLPRFLKMDESGLHYSGLYYYDNKTKQEFLSSFEDNEEDLQKAKKYVDTCDNLEDHIKTILATGGQIELGSEIVIGEYCFTLKRQINEVVFGQKKNLVRRYRFAIGKKYL